MTLTLRQTKGSELSHTELDANFSHLSDYNNLINKPTTYGPAFRATVTSGQSLPTSANSINEVTIIYNNVINSSDDYNSATGIFTTSVAGFYQVNASCAPLPTSIPSDLTGLYGAAMTGVYKNNEPIAAGPFSELKTLTGVGWAISASSVSTLIFLDVGDTLQCKIAYCTNVSGFSTFANIVPNTFQAVWIRP